ncbi:carbon-monoxide dehydrogenase large subunit [Albimonas donghaensis]|uniref:Carbon-monoxide dehydrogenase large subunit n=1 Tax=Albimonas donghaensis TaxID=356660 RepID=A0A1H2VGK6_9RHOB|nr:xanthine dehydrogenase family protein molybdopterin-binding subunit [Albimonas donghaensis]SDW67515.1 carbon-monoxide dehydrogenase large subunit [Albimonas donghaensis]
MTDSPSAPLPSIALPADPRRGRAEDRRLTTGRGRYTSDIAAEGALHAVFLRAPTASATVSGLDVAEAREMPGVRAVYTHEDLAADGIAPFVAPFKLPREDGGAWTQTDRPFLAIDRVRFVGEAVAMVVAETRAQAMDAAEAIMVDYDETPAVSDGAAALAPDAPLVWEDHPGNIAYVWNKGDWDATGDILAASHHVARIDRHVTRVAAVPMEPRSALAIPGPDRTTLYASIQNAPAMRGALVRVLGVPAEHVHVVGPDVGGSFGMKSGPLREETLVFWAARKLGAPLRWTADRTEAMLTDEPGRDMTAMAELGLDADGRFTALRVRLTIGIGAYASGRSLVGILNFGGVSGVYVIPKTAGEAIGVFSHSTPTAPYRGAGRPEATFAIEQVIDQAARDLGRDPVALRRANLIPPERIPYDTGFIFTYDSGNFAKVMDEAEARADLAGYAARKAASEARGLVRGLGVANCIEVAGGPFGNAGPDYSRVAIGADGRVRVVSGVMSAGQGLETAMTAFAAGRLGIDEGLIDYVQGDTAAMEVGKGMGGSAAMTTGAPAVQDGIRKALDKAREVAAKEMEVAEADLDYDAGEFRVAGTDRAMTLAAVAKAAEARAVALEGSGEFKPSDATYPNGCHVCEVEIDPETGVTRIDRYSAVEDIGRVLFPQMAEGQIHGGVAQALGQVLCEAVRLDADGQVLSATFMDYAMPRADIMPAYDCGFSEGQPTAINPLGVKGVGEAGSVGGLAAGMNAVCDALAGLGVERFEMPASPQRVWAAIQAAQG